MCIRNEFIFPSEDSTIHFAVVDLSCVQKLWLLELDCKSLLLSLTVGCKSILPSHPPFYIKKSCIPKALITYISKIVCLDKTLVAFCLKSLLKKYFLHVGKEKDYLLLQKTHKKFIS